MSSFDNMADSNANNYDNHGSESSDDDQDTHDLNSYNLTEDAKEGFTNNSYLGVNTSKVDSSESSNWNATYNGTENGDCGGNFTSVVSEDANQGIKLRITNCNSNDISKTSSSSSAFNNKKPSKNSEFTSSLSTNGNILKIRQAVKKSSKKPKSDKNVKVRMSFAGKISQNGGCITKKTPAKRNSKTTRKPAATGTTKNNSRRKSTSNNKNNNRSFNTATGIHNSRIGFINPVDNSPTCMFCGIPTSTHCALYLHVREKHNQQTCLVCLRVFHDSQSLFDHMKSFHRMNLENYTTVMQVLNVYNDCYFTCCTCNAIFSDTLNLERHPCLIAPSNNVRSPMPTSNETEKTEKNIVNTDLAIDDHQSDIPMHSPIEARQHVHSSPAVSQANDSYELQTRNNDDDVDDDFELKLDSSSPCHDTEFPAESSGSCMNNWSNYDEPTKSDTSFDSVQRNSPARYELDNLDPTSEMTEKLTNNYDNQSVATPPTSNVDTNDVTDESFVPNVSISSKDESITNSNETNDLEHSLMDEKEANTQSEEYNILEPEHRNEDHNISDASIKSDIFPNENVADNTTTHNDYELSPVNSQQPSVALALHQSITSMNVIDIIKECVRSCSSMCSYCQHATVVSINVGHLARHLNAEHRFIPTRNEDKSEHVRVKLREAIMTDDYMNIVSASSTTPSYAIFDNNFNCLQCSYKTDVYKDLLNHKRKSHHHGIFPCVICKCTFYFYSQFLCHLCPGVYFNDNILELKYHCCFCNHEQLKHPQFPSAFRLLVHLRKTHTACDICLTNNYEDQSELFLHMTKQHKLKHPCSKCKVEYNRREDVNAHLYWKHGTESATCIRCRQKKWPHAYHFCIQLPGYTCNQDPCENRNFAKGISLTVHKRVHMKQFNFPCTECEMKFIGSKLLAIHLNDVHNISTERYEIVLRRREERRLKKIAAEKKKLEEEANMKVDKRRGRRKKNTVDRPLLDHLKPLNLSSESENNDDGEASFDGDSNQKQNVDVAKGPKTPPIVPDAISTPATVTEPMEKPTLKLSSSSSSSSSSPSSSDSSSEGEDNQKKSTSPTKDSTIKSGASANTVKENCDESSLETKTEIENFKKCDDSQKMDILENENAVTAKSSNEGTSLEKSPNEKEISHNADTISDSLIEKKNDVLEGENNCASDDKSITENVNTFGSTSNDNPLEKDNCTDSSLTNNKTQRVEDVSKVNDVKIVEEDDIVDKSPEIINETQEASNNSFSSDSSLSQQDNLFDSQMEEINALLKLSDNTETIVAADKLSRINDDIIPAEPLSMNVKLTESELCTKMDISEGVAKTDSSIISDKLKENENVNYEHSEDVNCVTSKTNTTSDAIAINKSSDVNKNLKENDVIDDTPTSINQSAHQDISSLQMQESTNDQQPIEENRIQVDNGNAHSDAKGDNDELDSAQMSEYVRIWNSIEHSYCIPESIFVSQGEVNDVYDNSGVPNHSISDNSLENCSSKSQTPCVPTSDNTTVVAARSKSKSITPLSFRQEKDHTASKSKDIRVESSDSSGSSSGDESDSCSSYCCTSNCSCPGYSSNEENNHHCNRSEGSTTPEKRGNNLSPVNNNKSDVEPEEDPYMALLNLPETDLETEVETSDEEFYDDNPLMIVNTATAPLGVEEETTMAPVGQNIDNGVFANSPLRLTLSIPPAPAPLRTPPMEKSRKSRKRQSSSTPKEHKRKLPKLKLHLNRHKGGVPVVTSSGDYHDTSYTISSPKTQMSTTSIDYHHHYRRKSSSPSFHRSSAGAAVSSQLQLLRNHPTKKYPSNGGGGSSSKRLRRDRPKNKFYGYSTSEDEDTKPRPPPPRSQQRPKIPIRIAPLPLPSAVHPQSNHFEGPPTVIMQRGLKVRLPANHTLNSGGPANTSGSGSNKRKKNVVSSAPKFHPTAPGSIGGAMRVRPPVPPSQPFIGIRAKKASIKQSTSACIKGSTTSKVATSSSSLLYRVPSYIQQEQKQKQQQQMLQQQREFVNSDDHRRQYNDDSSNSDYSDCESPIVCKPQQQVPRPVEKLPPLKLKYKISANKSPSLSGAAAITQSTFGGATEYSSTAVASSVDGGAGIGDWYDSNGSTNNVPTTTTTNLPTDKKLYCFCQCPYDEVSEMIGCDDPDCKYEWYHFECVGIMIPPQGEWICPDCRNRKMK